MAATKFRLYQDALRHLADARLNVLTDDNTSRYALDDAYPEAVEFVTRQAAWRHALAHTSLAPVAGGTRMPGFNYAYDRPAASLRTHALFVLSQADGRERPLDIREQGARFFSNIGAGVFLRFISRDYLDPELADNPWPEHFAQAVAAYLAFLVANRVTGEPGAAGRMSQLFSSLLPVAVEHDAIPEDPWLEHQLSGAFARFMPAALKNGWWRWALKTVQRTAETDQLADFVDPSGYPYAFDLPADWTQTHSLFFNWNNMDCPFDIKEQESKWLTAAPQFIARYVSRAVYDTTLWPDTVNTAILAYCELQEAGEEADEGGKPGQLQPLAIAYREAMADALDDASVPRSPWLRFQLDGSFLQCARWVCEQARWRFAIRTVVLQPNFDPLPGDEVDPETGLAIAVNGYDQRYIKPNDWLRTIWFGRVINAGPAVTRLDIDYIDQGYTLHAAWEPLTLRYLSSERALDATQWTAHFRDALLAFLEHKEAAADPKQGALAGERFKFFQLQLKEAEMNDDNRDGPVYRATGRIVRGRYGIGVGQGIGPGFGPAQGWWG